jgi:hypothetical protein
MIPDCCQKFFNEFWRNFSRRWKYKYMVRVINLNRNYLMCPVCIKNEEIKANELKQDR